MEKEKRVIKNHPPQEVINKIREELSAPDYPYKNIGLGENPTAEEKIKYEICQTIARYKRENNLTDQQLANKMGANSHEDYAAGNADGKIGDFPINDTDVVNREDIERIRITGPEAELEKMIKLIFLKDDVKDTKNNAKDITPETTVGTSQDAILNLTAADFTGALTAKNIININDTDYNSKKAGTNEPAVVVDRDDQKQALLDLEQKLADLETNFPGGKNFQKGPELTLTDTSAEIGGFVNNGNTGLKSYFHGNWSSSTTVPDKTAKIYASGFTFNDDSDEFRKVTDEVLYKGFPVIDPEAVATAGATEADDITFNPAPRERYSKIAIDTFRHKDSFPIELPDNITNTNPPIKLFESNKREDCCGFQPGELTADGVLYLAYVF
ncbi:10705_t:CDS:2 [Cetraspora pellucida]|uniref:10705_t:CDS:1 n=1 Tax=Cetraspora pellucida TaxID=1433469 RepID=A0ACA9L1V3_9GLOM|nr:10705_t:CDS:2 [Cetraspora pellucida]